jgi:hypothetical protein
MVGLELALSVSGGATGQRQQPLLRTPEDWVELRRRMLELLPHRDQAGHRLMLEALHASLLATRGGPLQTSVEETARELCVAVVEVWDGRGTALSVRALESFYSLSVLMPNLPAGPQLGATLAVWLEHLDGEGVVFPQEPLAGLAVIAENEPRALRQAGWPAQHDERIAAVLEAATTALAEAEAVRAQLGEPEPPPVEDADYLSYETFRWRQMLADLQRAGADSNKCRTVIAQLAAAEAALRTWTERKEQEAEDRAAELEWRGADDEEYEDADPRAFDIGAVLGDL